MKYILITILLLFFSCSTKVDYAKLNKQYEYQKENRSKIYDSEKVFSVIDWRSPITGTLTFSSTKESPVQNVFIAFVKKGRTHNFRFKGGYYELCIETEKEGKICDHGNPYFPAWSFKRKGINKLMNTKHPFTSYVESVLECI